MHYKQNAKRDALRGMFSNFFVKKSRKSQPLAISGYYHSYVTAPGKPVWSNRDYAKFSDEGFIKNVITHRCISMIAKGAASISWKLHDAASRQSLDKHPVLELLTKPNPCSGGKEFFEAVYSHRLINGNAYIQALRLSDGRIAELHVLRPDRVTVIAGKSCIPAGYNYKVGEVEKTFPVDRLSGRADILHIKNFHPLDDWYGLSSIEAAAYSIDQHNQSGQWNQALLQNGARPSGALIVKGAGGNESSYLSEDQYNRIKQQLDEANTGAANAGKPLLLEGGLEWKEMSLTPKDMDFINTKDSAARDIALAFGVPPQLLGIKGDATYNNMAEARLMLWEQTIIPLIDNMAAELNNWLLPQYEGEFELSYNLDGVSALAPRREAMWNKVKDADFMTDDEKRAFLKL